MNHFLTSFFSVQSRIANYCGLFVECGRVRSERVSEKMVVNRAGISILALLEF